MAATVKVNVKWNKEEFKDLEVNMSESPVVFKSQLFALTGVLPERQKVMGLKGGPLKDDADWAAVGLKDGAKLMLVGTASELPKAPEKKTVFLEDLAPDEMAALSVLPPPGLKNLGNTCYMNSTLQCFRAVPELKTLLSNYRPAGGVDNEGIITMTMNNLWSQMAHSPDAVVPMEFVAVFRQVFPQFNETAPNGAHKQQDAEEAWNQLLTALYNKLPRDVMSNLFEIQFSEKLKCVESDAEPATESLSANMAVTCNINEKINHLMLGLKSGLLSELEKMSPTLGRNAIYHKTQFLHKLPGYLTVKFGRFEWRADKKTKTKILRSVQFPPELDVFDLCDPSLQEKLKPARQLLDAYEETSTLAAMTAAKDEGGVAPMDTDEPKKKKKGKGEKQKPPLVFKPMPVDRSPADSFNNTGFYELCGVVTHQGRTADSGHYVGWSRQSGDLWLKFDDDRVSETTTEEVMKLSGGGDFHIAYILLYRTLSIDDSKIAVAAPSV